jgi:preprotein translocase subunit SecG
MATDIDPPSGPWPAATLVGAALTGSGGATVSTVIALHGSWQAALAMAIVTVLISAAFSLTHIVLGFVERRRLADQRHTENVLRLRLKASLNRSEQDIHVTLATQNAALQAAVIQKIAARSPMADAPDAILALRSDRTPDRPPL